MKRRQREAVVAELDAQLLARGSWGGETHIQKAVFFLQEMVGVPTDFPFILYKYGPFSRELRSELGAMRTDGFLQLVPQPAPYGPQLRPTPTASHQLFERWPKTLERYSGEIEFVASTLGSAGVGTLERWATALWVMRETPDGDLASWARRIHEVKPHVSIEDATRALERVREIERDAVERFPHLH